MVATRSSRRQNMRSVRNLFAVLAVAAAGSACASGATKPAATPSTVTMAPTVPSTAPVPPTTAATPSPEANAPAPVTLEIDGESSPAAIVEIRFDDGRDPLPVQADATGAYHLTVNGLAVGTNSMSLTAHAGGDPDKATYLSARFLVRRDTSTTQSALACPRPIAVVVDLREGSAGLRTSC
jgi:hypothetical protein